MRRFKTRARATKAFVVLSAVLVLGSLGVGVFALAAPSVPAPTISSKPANPTNSTATSFTYTDSSSITRFECSLDGSAFSACGTSRPSTKIYPPQSQGSHTFQVRAVSGTQTSSATSSTWTIDTTAPSVVSINRSDPNPTNQSTVHWTVAFSEAVQGVDAGDFYLVNGSLLAPLITGVSGSGSTYAVTATTGAVVPSGTLGLNLHNNGSIHDLAGNVLGSPTLNHDFTGQVYTIDKVPPPKPVLTTYPDNPNGTAISTFAWTEDTSHEPEGVSFQCSIDNGSWQTCTSPDTFTVNSSNNGTHQFAVRAVDGAGNISAATTYSWKVSNVGFTISGNATAPLYPGLWRPIAIAITNPNHFAIIITSVTTSVSNNPANCPTSSNIELQQSSLSPSNTYTVPAQSTVTIPSQYWPQIRLKNLATNQDSCKAPTSFNLSYSGVATK